MKESKTDFDLIKPKLLTEDTGIKAWFTLKNAEWGDFNNEISGLNLGFNTPESREIVAHNRLTLLSSLGLNTEWVAYADQVHSNRVRLITQGGTYPETDGLVTQIPGLTLCIQVADCAAVLIWDPQNKIVAALHAGWRGAVGDIVPKGIDMMINRGADLQKIKVFVSPCLSLRNFEVGEEVASQFPKKFVDYKSYDKPHVNLKEFLRYQMVEAGIDRSQIEVREECTVDEADSLYSYRREGDKSGRMMALIQIVD
ncbi:MAG TPA: peptidoglycan editing factor PgeF [Balneolaceae bacterium]|nr:peptidoglycan editing factor PgeF [Balneolaceae bacterium]